MRVERDRESSLLRERERKMREKPAIGATVRKRREAISTGERERSGDWREREERRREKRLRDRDGDDRGISGSLEWRPCVKR